MGKIQYYCQAKIDRPWRFDHKVKEMFTVLTIYDLNLSPMTAVGVSAEDSKSLGCCCCVDGTVYFQANIPKTGFVPGECIKVNLHLDNRSNRPMHSFEIYLLQVVSYTAAREGIGYEHRKNESRKISGVTENLDEIQVPSQYSVTRDIPIPAVVATMGNNSIVQVQYVVECKLVPTGLSTSRKIQLPLIVGTVPLLLLPTAPLFDSGNAFPSDLPPAFSTVQPLPAEPPPPSYEECMFGRVDARNDEDNEHTRGNLAFAPKYPVYRF
uniref:Arrestin C-terminal-like domain-containing protein n=1 Tax=Plectus sambesii TaxID=2011161 RepID=A0A914WHJ6_9BILA